MNHINGPAMVIDDGGVASLVVCCLANDPTRVTPYAAPPSGASAPNRVEAVKRRADLLGLGQPILREATGDEPAEDPFGEITAILLDAGRQAVRLGLNVLIWPVHLGLDLDAMERELARARLVERLVSLDAPGGAMGESLRLETPLLDLTPEQIGALVKDLDAPIDAAWWCVKDAPAPCGRCGACQRWEAALSSATSAGAGPEKGSGAGVGADDGKR